jgi:hypothetical protein
MRLTIDIFVLLIICMSAYFGASFIAKEYYNNGLYTGVEIGINAGCIKV